MSMPKDTLSWATDGDHSDAGRPWDGQPTKVDPGAGVRATGHLPDRRAPAEYENHWKNAAGRWQDYLQYVQLKNWEGLDPATFAARVRRVVYNAELDLYSYAAEGAGCNVATSSDLFVFTDRGGANTGVLHDMASRTEDLPGAGLARFMLAAEASKTFESDDGLTYTERLNDPGGGTDKTWTGVVYVHSDNAPDANGSFCFCGFDVSSSQGYVYTTGDGGNTFTQQLSVATKLFRAIAVSSDGLYLAVVGDNDAAYRSTDGGNTWNADSVPGDVSDWTSVAWDGERGCFFARAAGGFLYRRDQTSSTWVTVRDDLGTDSGSSGIECFGSAMVFTSESEAAIYFSTDGGLTSRRAPAPDTTPVSVSLADGAFFVSSKSGDDVLVRTIFL